MRIAQLTVPQFDNNGATLIDELVNVTNLIVDHFGGATVYDTVGLWKDADGVEHVDNNSTFHIAMDDTPWNTETLRQIARQTGEAMRQKAMFIVLPSGEVEIMDI